MLASTAKPLIEILIEQSERFEREVSEGSSFLYKFLRLMRAHKNIRKRQEKFLEKTLHNKKDFYRSGGIAKVNAKWFQEHRAFNPADSIKCCKRSVIKLLDLQKDQLKYMWLII
ncbi:hypothetical protein ACE1TI_17550 [Alteribacillus sp. JSM 102045]|uniref:hypothetical protein n=1 Tax=Alteribacillus sp. JSM 102045 TaxID=1562101 RepID=UPI0035BF1BDF